MSSSVLLRKYFLTRFEDRFEELYPKTELVKELKLLNRLRERYETHVILEAIDLFLKTISRDKATISYFASMAFFEDRFQTVINSGPILRFKRIIQAFSPEQQSKVKELLDEYMDYARAPMLSAEEIARKEEILAELERMDAERSRTENAFATPQR